MMAMVGVACRSRAQAVLHRCSRWAMVKEMERAEILSRRSRSMSSSLPSSAADSESGKSAAIRKQLEAAAREDRLDFLTAARILFSTPQKPRTFGLDFHLWQFFVACLPSVAVYLIAQYARYEMRRMEKERDDAERVNLELAVAEQLAQTTDDGNKSAEALSRLNPDESLASHLQSIKVVTKNSTDAVVVLPEKEFLELKSRLDAMEDKVKAIESTRPQAPVVTSAGSEPAIGKGSEKDNVQKIAAAV